MTTLVVAAHPDDEVLGCGGTIARRVQEGEDVDVLILGEGATSRAESRSAADRSVVEGLKEASIQASRELGVRDVLHRDFPDNRFDKVALLDIVKSIESVIGERQPKTIICQHGGDVNVDHRRTFEAVLAATRPQPQHPVRSVYSFEVASSTEWAFHTLAPVFHPSLFIDISSQLDIKLRAMDAYRSELREPPHPRSLERLGVEARRTGAIVGVDAAEAFYVVRDIQ